MWNFFFSSALAEGEAAAATPEPTWLQTVFGKFGELSAQVWIALIVLLILGIGLLAISRSKAKWSPKLLAYAALSIALSFVLSYIRLWKMPQGGSITPASMLPIMLFSYTFGTIPGILAGAASGILQYIQDGGMRNIWQFLLDYPIAFAAIGLAGFLKNRDKKFGLYTGIVIASFARFVAAVLSGVAFWADYTPAGMSPLGYSIVYNGTYMLPETVICVILALVVAPRVLKILKAK